MHVQLLVDGLRAAGDEVDVFTRPSASRLLGAWDPFARRALADRVRDWRPDVVHAHNVVRELSVSVLTVDAPTVLTVHDGRLLGDADGQGRALRTYQRLRAPLDAAVARRSVEAVLAVSAPLAERLRTAGFRAVEHVPPWATSPVVPLAPPTASSDVVFLGRLDPDKGVPELLAAFARVRGGRLLLAGRGSLAVPADDRVVPVGVLDRGAVSHLLASCRAVVLPSLPARRPEGSPLALVEALVHGRPLVVSDDPGSVALTRDGAAGLVVPAGDVDALAAALQSLLDDDALVERLAAGAAAAGAEHLPETGVARVRAAYARVVG